MELRLMGQAVEPCVVLEPDRDRMELGHVFAGDTVVKKLKLRNKSSLEVRYCVRIESRERSREKLDQKIFSEYNIYTHM